MQLSRTAHFILPMSVTGLAAFALLPFTGYPLIFPFVILKYIVLVSSLNLITGYTGYVDFGHVVFYGLGVYGAALSVYHLRGIFFALPFIAVLLGGLVASIVAIIIGSVLLRLRGAYFALAMLSFNEVVRLTFLNLPQNWAGGTFGIPLPAIYDPLLAYYGMLILVVATLSFMYLLANSSFGVCLKAIREDEDAAEDLGIPTFNYKLIAFALSGLIAGLAGGFDLWYTAYASPDINFELAHTVEMFAMMLAGGSGTVFGPVLGAFILIPFRDFVWALSPFIYTIIFGALIVGLILLMPYGILGLLDRLPKFKGKIK
ncbi:MAG: branched-chain amino acid ABC transporter permease [Candidatus Heimdallarchaeota archaeon]